MAADYWDDWKYYYERARESNIAPINPLPDWPHENEFFVSAPLHVMSIATRACVFCGEGNTWSTYKEYIDDFYDREWEGERDHKPASEYLFNMIYSLCLAQGGSTS